MAKNMNVYSSPLVERNASKEMAQLFSPQKKFSTWRRLWLELAKAQKKLGLNIKQTQINEMARRLDDIDFRKAAKFEKKFRHDVMAHVYTFGQVAPKAAPVIHLGATSCYVGDNADLIILREGLEIIAGKVACIIDLLAGFAKKHRSVPTLGFTHYQPAQLTTVGKRAALWAYEFVMDLAEIEHRIEMLPFRGVKGTTGTQASFLALFGGNENKVKRLDEMVTKAFGFKKRCAVAGQTYQRKIDTLAVNALASVAQSAHKMCNDIRLLANLKEIEEPFEKSQIGSSAMAYKRNPMRCERATALSRLVLSLASSPAMTAAEQWLERTLDDSANRRMIIAETFMAVDGILGIASNVIAGLQVHPAVIKRNILVELPFMATENILMEAVKAGGDRQELHERIRQLSIQAAEKVREGKEHVLMEELRKDPLFSSISNVMDEIVDPEKFTGRSAEQVKEFISAEVDPLLETFKDLCVDEYKLDV